MVVEKSQQPAWTDGLITPPDANHLRFQTRIWGFFTILGIVLAPVREYLNRFLWLVCIGQLSFRGQNQMDGNAGEDMFSIRGGRGIRRNAFFVGIVTWAVALTASHVLLPSYVKALSSGPGLMYLVQNLVFYMVCLYLDVNPKNV